MKICTTVLAFVRRARILCAAVFALDFLRWFIFVGAKNFTCIASDPFGKLRAALGALLRVSRITCAAVGAVDVWPNFGPLDDGGILNDLLFGRLIKFNMLGLGRSTIRSDFLTSSVSPAAVGTFPF